MQIGQLQDEEDEAANVLQDETLDPFRNSCLGTLISGRGAEMAFPELLTRLEQG